MSEQAFAAAAAAQIGAHAADVQGGMASGQDDLASAVAAGGSGVTESDISQILAQIKAMQARLDVAESQRRADAPPALVSTAQTLKSYVDVHNDPKAMDLADAMLEAAQNSTESGDTGPLSKIAERLARHLRKNPPYPGENHHYRQALDWAENHIVDAVEAFIPPPPSGAHAVTSDRPAAKVLEGTRVG